MDNTTRELIFEQLRKGTVPEAGHAAFAVGIDAVLNEIQRNMDAVSSGDKKGNIKFLRGNFGCGKTFISKYALSLAREQGFVTSFVVISPNDTQFHNFQVVYNKICQNFQSKNSKSLGVLVDALDRWFGQIENQFIQNENIDYNHPQFDELMLKRFETDLSILLNEDVSQDFLSVIRGYFLSKQKGDVAASNHLLSWLSGSANIRAEAKKIAGIKGEIDSKTALIYLKGILAIFHRAGYKGLVIVLDEMETILKARHDVRQKSMTGVRQITDAAEGFKGLLWLLTGTEDFFDTPKGVKGLQPLHDRISFKKVGNYINYRQPQLELKTLTDERLFDISLRLRDLYLPTNPESFRNKLSDDFIKRYIHFFTDGFSKNLGVVPRYFIRDLVNLFDIVDQNEDIDLDSELKIPDLNPEDLSLFSPTPDNEPDSPYSEVEF